MSAKSLPASQRSKVLFGVVFTVVSFPIASAQTVAGKKVVPAPKVAPTSRAAFLTSTASHTLALMNDGTVWSWGDNGTGQLGNGTTVKTEVPVQVKGLSEISAISIGGETTTTMVLALNGTFGGTASPTGKSKTVGHSLALKKEGTVWAWGNNSDGELGNGTKKNSSVPVPVSNLTDVTAISAAATFNLALKADGTVWAWGENRYGQLGNGSSGDTADTAVPVQVKGLTDVAQVSAGDANTCLALKRDGTVWAWGWGSNGELGNGDRRESPYPVKVRTLAGVAAVAVGSYQSLALMQDGTVRAWGTNALGKDHSSATPVSVKPLEGIVAIAAGGEARFALAKDGILWAWGDNTRGQLGIGTTEKWNDTPAPVKGLSGVTSLSAGALTTFAKTEDGAVWTWGNGRTAPSQLSSLGPARAARQTSPP